MSTEWLAELNEPARQVLAALGRTRRYAPGAPLFLEGDPGGSVIIVQSGRVKVFATSDTGHHVLLAVRGPGDVLGDLSAIDGEPRSATGTALDTVDAQVIPAEQFREFLVAVPDAALVLLRVVIHRMRDADRVRVEFGARDTLGRVAARLVELAETHGEATEDGVKVALPLTQDDLAQWVAASREAVARALASLRRRHLITTARRDITIIDLDGLRAAAR